MILLCVNSISYTMHIIIDKYILFNSFLKNEICKKFLFNHLNKDER
jgi:hypothetical protein